MNFTHLHVHTEYSLLDGSNKIQEYVNRVKELGMDSAAITDHGVMYGVIDFYRAARAAGINPVLGCEVYVAPGSRFDREIGSGDDRYYHLVLLAENNQGYANLMKIVSKSFVEGFYYKPRVDLEVLEKYHEGIIALSACLAGEIPRFLTRGLYEEGKRAALRYREIFGKNNFFRRNMAAVKTAQKGLQNFFVAVTVHLLGKKRHIAAILPRTDKKDLDTDKIIPPGQSNHIGRFNRCIFNLISLLNIRQSPDSVTQNQSRFIILRLAGFHHFLRKFFLNLRVFTFQKLNCRLH